MISHAHMPACRRNKPSKTLSIALLLKPVLKVANEVDTLGPKAENRPVKPRLFEGYSVRCEEWLEVACGTGSS